jgi:Major Facilitator Superfamily
LAGFAQSIQVPTGMPRVGLALEDAVVHETAEALGQDGLRNVEMGLEVVEALDSVEGVADYQERPSLAQHLEGARERTVLSSVLLAKHASILASMGLIIELMGTFRQTTGSVIELHSRRVPDMSATEASVWNSRVSGARRLVWAPAALLLLSAGWASNQFTPMLLVYHHTLGLGTGTLEAMFGFYALGLIPGLLVAGELSHTRGRRPVVIWAAALSLAGTVVLAAAGQAVWMLFAGRLLTGLSTGAAFSAGTSWLRELSLPPFGEASDHATARRAAIWMTSGFALGPLVAGLLAQWAPLPRVLPYMPHVAVMAIVLATLPAAPETLSERAPRAIRRSLPSARSSRFRGIVAPIAPWVFVCPGVAFALLPSVVGADSATDGIALTAAITTVTAVAGVLAQPLARRLDAGAATNRAATAGLVTLVAGLAVAVLTAAEQQDWMLVPSAILLGGAYGLCLVAGLVEVQRLAPPTALAGLTAVFYALGYLGFAAPFVLALAAHLASYPLLLTITAALALATMAHVTRQSRRQHA